MYYVRYISRLVYSMKFLSSTMQSHESFDKNTASITFFQINIHIKIYIKKIKYCAAEIRVFVLNLVNLLNTTPKIYYFQYYRQTHFDLRLIEVA